MKIKRILSGEYVENCYICSDDDKNCFIVDPGEGFDKISEYIESNELKPSFILLTHGHGDHIASAEKLKKRFQTKTCSFFNASNAAFGMSSFASAQAWFKA